MPTWTSRPTLYVKQSLEDQRLRALLAEKGDPIEIVEVNSAQHELNLLDVNVDRVYPVLIERTLVAYGTPLDEYIHERWPGPQLLPLDPYRRAQARMLEGMIKKWYGLQSFELCDRIADVEKVFDPTHNYFFGSQFSIVDVALLPLFKLDVYDPATAAFSDYMDRVCCVVTRKARAA